MTVVALVPFAPVVGLLEARLGAAVPEGSLSVGLERALDPLQDRPRLRAGAERMTAATRWGDRYTIVHHPDAGTYLRFTGAESDLVDALDGKRTVAEIAADELGDDDTLSVEQIVDLVAELHRAGLLERRPHDVYAAAGERFLTPRRRRARRVGRALRSQSVALHDADRFVAAAHRRGGRLLFSPPATAVGWAVIVVGLAGFVTADEGGLTGPLSGGAAAALLALTIASLFCHEMGHALAVKQAGRHVPRAGFQLYLGNPAFFIDSSDMLFADRRQRAVNAMAGPWVEAVTGGLAGIYVWLAPGGAAAPMLYRFAGLAFLNVLVNLVPFLELDGYWLMTDLLDTPRLRPRSLAVLRHEIPDRIRRRRGPLTPTERGLAAFGVAGCAFTGIALVIAFTLWAPLAGGLVSQLWHAGPVGRAGLVLLAVLVLGPVARAGLQAATVVGRRARGVAGDIRFRLETSWRVEAAAAVAALPIVDGLDDEALSELAGRVVRRRVAPYEAVVRQGDAADAFFLVRRGLLEVVERDERGGEHALRQVGPGDCFGELALLDARARTATVRAVVDSEVFSVDAGTFKRIVAPTMEAPELAPAVGPALEVLSLPPFRNLDLRDAMVVAEEAEWLTVAPLTDVVAQGGPSDGFYVLVAGQADVLTDGRPVAHLRVGDHFGELALLHHTTRAATVRTTTPARLLRLDGDGFLDLVASAVHRSDAPGESHAAKAASL